MAAPRRVIEFTDYSHLESILENKLEPIRSSIERLEASHQQVVAVMLEQAKQNQIVEFLTKEFEANKKTFDTLFSRVREIENNSKKDAKESDHRWWEVTKMILTVLAGAVIGHLTAGKLPIGN